ncbi:MAG: fumarylacetoacetate hydrolase family protein [Ktedonobacterales bacterium]
MKLVTYIPAGANLQSTGRAGVLLGETNILDVETLLGWAARNTTSLPALSQPITVLQLLQQEQEGMAALRAALVTAERARLEDLQAEAGLVLEMNAISLRAPVPDAPSFRDFYTFEQHVQAARARRGAGMIPEWYQIAVFYFSNTSELYGPGEPVPYPRLSHEVDFELEMAAVVGRAGRDISADEAPDYIAGYMVLNDWSARDLWRVEQPLNMGPAKGKDFATSIGPYLVTPDELAEKRIGSGKDERYDLTMTGRINGDQLSRDNAKNMYYTFPQMIERASQHVRLRPGDIIGSGTCGTGCILELGTERHRWLLPGDLVEMEIERLGTLASVLVGA